MKYEQYTTVIESKVNGAWNFHNALANTPLDFFVAISSVAGAVGNRGQAAYAAANCFLNAFVQWRLAQGLPASSLDLTAISDSGKKWLFGIGERDSTETRRTFMR